MDLALLPAVTGLGTGLALIIAIGAQNAYLLRLGITGGVRLVLPAVVVCAASDGVLIVAGTLGVGVVVERFPVALVVVRVVGAAFLVGYGVLAARRAIRPAGAVLVADGVAADGAAVAAGAAAADGGAMAGGPGARTIPPTVGRVVATMLALTWLNPHVYLDTLVFLGSVANQQGHDGRWAFVVGAVAASCIWFASLGFGARLLRPVFVRPGAWRVLDGCIAVVMIALGVRIAIGI